MLLDQGTDHKEIAKTILYFVEHEEASREMGGNGKQLISKKYTWEKTVENINAIYGNVLDNI